MVSGDRLPKGAIKLLLNLALLAGDALVRGGRLDVGVQASRVHRERFTPRTREIADQVNGEHAVQWVRSGITDTQQAGESLLDAANRVDANVPFICEAGECGECKIRVLKGEVLHEADTCLSPTEVEAGLALACSSFRISFLWTSRRRGR